MMLIMQSVQVLSSAYEDDDGLMLIQLICDINCCCLATSFLSFLGTFVSSVMQLSIWVNHDYGGTGSAANNCDAFLTLSYAW